MKPMPQGIKPQNSQDVAHIKNLQGWLVSLEGDTGILIIIIIDKSAYGVNVEMK